jgi:hypothetical protein
MDTERCVNESFEKNGERPLSTIPLPNVGNMRLGTTKTMEKSK